MSSEKKKQHYIPKFFLKLFSVNNANSQIGLFIIKDELFVKNVSISPQAQENYFYGKDGVIEDALSKIETEAAPIIKEIISGNILPIKNSPAYIKAFAFFIMLSYRTKSDAEAVNNIATEVLNLFVEQAEDLTDEEKNDFKSYKVVRESPAEVPVTVMAQRLHLGYDLKAKLVVNNTSQKLIISDNPAIRYNQFLEQRRYMGGVDGIATKGLQVFFPISPNHLIIFYDEWAYRIGNKKSDVLQMCNVSDVHSLNLLQIANCTEHVYFNEEITEAYMRSLALKWSKINPLEKIKTKLKDSFSDENSYEHFSYNLSNNCMSVNLDLSFITQTKKAKSYILNKEEFQIRKSVAHHFQTNTQG